MIFKFVLSAATLALAGCAAMAPRQIDLVSKFDPNEVAWATGKGSGKIVGSGVIQTVGGIPRNCAGNKVGAIPVSTYSTERLQAIYGNSSKAYWPAAGQKWNIPRDAQYEASFREAICDAQGTFEFDDLPAGSYFLTTSVVWSTGQQYASPQGGFLMLKVLVEDGKSKKVVLSP